MPITELSDKDQRLLQLLKKNARATITELANELGITRATVQSRLKRLENGQVIKGYTVKLAESIGETMLTAHVSIEIRPDQYALILNGLKKIVAIEALYTLSGKFDLLAVLKAPTTVVLDKTLDRIAQLAGVRSTESVIILSTKWDYH